IHGARKKTRINLKTGLKGQVNILLIKGVIGDGTRRRKQKQDQGGWKKKEGWVPKRDHPERPVRGPNDGPRLGGPFTTPKQRPRIFTPDEQEILNEINSN
ncbi:hypothetical protein Tco_1488307, partial [Tanacetum coccineum]